MRGARLAEGRRNVLIRDINMVKLEIIYSKDHIIVFSIDVELYYLKTGPDIPHLYDANVRGMLVPNIDSWISAKTRQRYSYQTLCDLGAAFRSGLKSAYDHSDLIKISEQSVKQTIKELFYGGKIYDYNFIFWIEVCPTDAIEKHLRIIRDNLQEIIEKVGVDKLHNDLNRMLKVCLKRQSDCADVCTKLIERIGKRTSEPTYPDADTLNAMLISNVKKNIFKSFMSKYKTVSKSVEESVDVI